MALVDALSSLACASTGFDESAVSRDAITRLARRLLAAGARESELLARITRSDAGLVAEVRRTCIVGETYLFRQPEHFAFLEEHIVPALLSTAPAGGALEGSTHTPARTSLRVWSAGCASGEEAWSLAASLRAACAPYGSVDIDVLGTDLLDEHIASARRGRCRTAWRRGDHRHSVVERDSDRVLPELTALTRFEVHDLRTPLDEGARFDVVFCRNVLIYVRREDANIALAHIAERMAPGAFFVAGPVDLTGTTLPPTLVPYGDPALSTFVRVTHATAAAMPRTATPRAMTTMPRTLTPSAPIPTPGAPIPAPLPRAMTPSAPIPTSSAPIPTPGAPIPTSSARTPTPAPRTPTPPPAPPPRATIDEAVEQHVRALSAVERGDVDGALQLLARAVAQFPGYAPAWVERGLLLARNGDVRGADAAMREALARLSDVDPDAIVRGPEPAPARYWAASARAYLERHGVERRGLSGGRGGQR